MIKCIMLMFHHGLGAVLSFNVQLFHPFLSLGIWGSGVQQSLLQKPLKERRTALRNTFKEIDGRFRFATYMDHKVSSISEISR